MRDYLTDMVKETIMRHHDLTSENKKVTKEEMDEMVYDLVDEYLGKIVTRLIDY